jgi:hypothetical protein
MTLYNYMTRPAGHKDCWPPEEKRAPGEVSRANLYLSLMALQYVCNAVFMDIPLALICYLWYTEGSLMGDRQQGGAL